jgi:ribonuclease P protein component
MREIVRQILPEVAPGWDLVFVARAPAAEAEYAALAQDIAGLLRRAKLLAANNH